MIDGFLNHLGHLHILRNAHHGNIVRHGIQHRKGDKPLSVERHTPVAETEMKGDRQSATNDSIDCLHVAGMPPDLISNTVCLEYLDHSFICRRQPEKDKILSHAVAEPYALTTS